MSPFSDKLHSAPFIRLLIPFTAGIILGDLCTPELKWIFLGAALFFSVLLPFFITVSYKRESLFGLFLFPSLVFLGLFITTDQKYHPQPLQKGEYFAVFDEYPLEREKSFRAVIRLAQPKIKIIAYFEKSEVLSQVEPGTVIWFLGQPELLQKTGNPFEFDYQAYAIRKKIGHRIFLSDRNFYILTIEKSRNLVEWSLIIRNRLLNMIEKCGLKGEVFHLVSAISLGAREELEPETTQSFSKTGVIHVLAVSGMNVGIIYVVLDLLLRFMKRRRGGIILHTLLILSALWSYALITGLSASVLRAAAMFSSIVIGTNLSRHPNIYNTLGASAFILLCFNPLLVYDVGFQLSYAAVVSIVFFHPFLYGLYYFKYWIPNQIWILLTVSLAAQIGTIPFLLHYFHQFPTWFLLANLMVIPLVTAILYLSFLVFAVAPIAPYLGVLMTQFLELAGKGMLFSVHFVERLPYSVLTGLYPSDITLFLILLLAVLISLFIIDKKPIAMKLALLSIIILLIISNLNKYQKLAKNEIVVFHLQGKTLIAFTSGAETIWLTTVKIGTDEKLKYFIQPYEGFRGIKKSQIICLSEMINYKTNIISGKENFLNFCGLSLYIFNDHQLSYSEAAQFPHTDLIITSEKSIIDSFLLQKHPPSSIIVDNRTIVNAGERNNNQMIGSNGLKIFSTALGGAVQITFSPSAEGKKNNIRCRYFNQ